MDYIREFDIRLEKEMYYAGEIIAGAVFLDTIENFKLRAIRVVLRGKAHAEWKVVVSGDRRTVKDDQYFIDDRATIWGKDKPEGNVPILPRGIHHFPFRFQLPESSLPCSFESKPGFIRYYLKVTIDIPYASPPQGMKYFTIIGPHIDCMEDQYLKPMVGQDKRSICCFCCERGQVSLKAQLERSAYVCGESIKLKADIDNQSEEDVRLKVKVLQYVEYFIDRGVLGVSREVQHPVLEYRGDPVPMGTRTKWDSSQSLVVPVMPPSLVGVCRLLQIYYVLKVNLEFERSGDELHMHFPLTIATVPFRIPNSGNQPVVKYETSCEYVEGGRYIGPEFLMGEVYDGDLDTRETVVLYRPVYARVERNLPRNHPSKLCLEAKHESKQKQDRAAAVTKDQGTDPSTSSKDDFTAKIKASATEKDKVARAPDAADDKGLDPPDEFKDKNQATEATGITKDQGSGSNDTAIDQATGITETTKEKETGPKATGKDQETGPNDTTKDQGTGPIETTDDKGIDAAKDPGQGSSKDQVNGQAILAKDNDTVPPEEEGNNSGKTPSVADKEQETGGAKKKGYDIFTAAKEQVIVNQPKSEYI